MVEDCGVLRTALADLLTAVGSFEKLVPVGNVSQALEAYARLRPSVVLIGPSQESAQPIDVAAALLRAQPDTRILMFVLHYNNETIAEALRLGVAGVIGRKATRESLLSALTKVAEGQTYCEQPIDALLRLIESVDSGSPQRLAPREQKVLSLIGEGRSSKEIANELGLGVETVRYYRKSIMRKLKVHNVAALLRVAVSENLISGPRDAAHRTTRPSSSGLS